MERSAKLSAHSPSVGAFPTSQLPMFKAFMSKKKIVDNLKLAKQYALDGEYRKSLELYANESLFSRQLMDMDASDAEHFLLCGHAFQ